MDKRLSERLILNILYICLVFSLLYLFSLGIGLELSGPLQFLLVSLGALMVKFFLFHPLILYGLLLLALIIATVVHYYLLPVLSFLAERTYLLLDNIVNNLRGKENISPENILLFWLLLIIFLSLFTAYILFKRKKIYILLPAYLFPLIFYWYGHYDQAYGMIALFLFSFLILLGLDSHSKLSKNLVGKGELETKSIYLPWLKTVLVYSVLILVLSSLLPKSNEFIYWPWLQKNVYSLYPDIENLRSSTSFVREEGETVLFSFSSTGFQEDPSRLGGPVSLSDKKIMTVFAEGPQYLRGNVKQLYTGELWHSIKAPSQEYGLIQDFSGLSSYEKSRYHRKEDLTIRYKNFASNTIFTPYLASTMVFPGKHSIWVNPDGVLSFPNGIFQEESYSLTVFKPLDYYSQISQGIQRKMADEDNIHFYLQLPNDRISDRVKDLTKSLVADAANDFEKAQALVAYLRESFPYNLDVEALPPGREFVDFFLFEGQEGYCTYYASALAIMLRLEGIPSRYIEGYIAQEESDPGIYEVRHSNGHAWVEAFIEPVGWLSFEATPIYPSQELGEPLLPPQEDIMEDPRENHQEEIDSADRDHLIDEGLRQEEGEDDNNEILDEETINPTSLSLAVKYLILGLLAILPLRFLWGLAGFYRSQARSRRLDARERIIYLYQEILSITALFGYGQEAGETHYEYANRIAYRFSYQNKKNIQEVTDIFVRNKYSQAPLIEGHLEKMEEFRDTIDRHLKNSWGWPIYYYRKYIKREFFKG